MMISDLYNIWYDGNRNDINTCWNMLRCAVRYTDEDDRMYKKDLYEGIMYAMEDWLHDNK